MYTWQFLPQPLNSPNPNLSLRVRFVGAKVSGVGHVHEFDFGRGARLADGTNNDTVRNLNNISSTALCEAVPCYRKAKVVVSEEKKGRLNENAPSPP